MKFLVLPPNFTYQELSGYCNKSDYIFINGNPEIYLNFVKNHYDTFHVSYPGSNTISYHGPSTINLNFIWQLFIKRQVYVFGLPDDLHFNSLQEIADRTGVSLKKDTKDSVSLDIKFEHQGYLGGVIFAQLFSYLPSTFINTATSAGTPSLSKMKIFLKAAGHSLGKILHKTDLTLDDLQTVLNGASKFSRQTIAEVDKIYKAISPNSFNGVEEMRLNNGHPLSQLYPEFVDRPLHEWLKLRPRMEQPLLHPEYYLGCNDRPLIQIGNRLHAPGSSVFLLPPPGSMEDILWPISAVLEKPFSSLSAADSENELSSMQKSTPEMQKRFKCLIAKIKKISPLEGKENRPAAAVQPGFRTIYQNHHHNKAFPIIGESLAMELLYRQIVPVLNDKTGHVLILGEAGSGKELVADIIMKWHEGSSNSMNCAHLPVTLAHSLLFGHVKGAFTNATQDTSGYIVENKKGYLFMDEIEALPVEVMPMLLRYLESGEFQRAGDPNIRRSSVKIIAASNDDSILQGKFLHRGFISRFRYIIRVPSLKYRRGDIPLLIQYFTEMMIKDLKLSPDMYIPKQQVEILQDEDWSHSNVRGLKNAVYNLLSRQVSYGLSPAKGKETKPPGRPLDFDDETLADIFKRSKNTEGLKESLKIIINGNPLQRYKNKPAMRQRIRDNPELKRLFEEKFAKDY